MKELEKRLIYLFTGELFAVTTFTFIYLRELAASQSYALMYALGVLNFILLQSSFYWFIKWCRWKRKTKCVSGLIFLHFLIVKATSKKGLLKEKKLSYFYLVFHHY